MHIIHYVNGFIPCVLMRVCFWTKMTYLMVAYPFYPAPAGHHSRPCGPRSFGAVQTRLHCQRQQQGHRQICLRCHSP